MSARKNLEYIFKTTVTQVDAEDATANLDAYRAEVLLEAAEALTKKFGVTNRAAGELRRMAKESR